MQKIFILVQVKVIYPAWVKVPKNTMAGKGRIPVELISLLNLFDGDKLLADLFRKIETLSESKRDSFLNEETVTKLAIAPLCCLKRDREQFFLDSLYAARSLVDTQGGRTALSLLAIGSKNFLNTDKLFAVFNEGLKYGSITGFFQP